VHRGCRAPDPLPLYYYYYYCPNSRRLFLSLDVANFRPQNMSWKRAQAKFLHYYTENDLLPSRMEL
jgi:hypothetical protein